MPGALTRNPSESTSKRAATGRQKRQRKIQPVPSVPSGKSSLPSLPSQPVAARMAAAGSRRAELEALLHAAPPNATSTQLRTLVLDENVTGKRTAASRDKVWRQLKQNYTLAPALPEYQAFLQSVTATSAPSDRGLLFLLMLARNDRLFREVVLESVSPHLSHPGTPVRSDDVQAALDRIVGAKRQWSEETRITARQHVLSALKDFGALQGGARKKTLRLYPGAYVTLFAARLAQLEGLSPRQTLESAWFRLLGVDAEGAWNLLHAAASAGVLRCRRQADVIEIDLPRFPVMPTVDV